MVHQLLEAPLGGPHIPRRGCRRRRPRGVLQGTLPMLLLMVLVGPAASARAPGDEPSIDAEPSEKVATTLEVGQALPVQVRRLGLWASDGEAVEVASLRQANGLLLIFASNTCPYVLDWLDRLPRLATRGAAQEVGVVVVNANARQRSSTDSPEEMVALWQRQGLELPYLVDRGSELALALGARRTPEVFLFDAAWRLVYRGAIDDLSGPFEQVTAHYAAEALRQMLDGDPVVRSETPAIGCAIQKPRRRRSTPP